MEARPLADGVHVMERPLRFFGVEMGTRMTVLQTERGLLVHSPIDACAIGGRGARGAAELPE